MIETTSIPLFSLTTWLAATGAWGVIWLVGWLAARLMRLNRQLPEFGALTFALGLALTPVLVLWVGRIPGLILQPWFWAPLSIAGWVMAVDVLRLNMERWRDEWGVGAEVMDAGGRAGRLIAIAGWLTMLITLVALLGSAFSPPIHYDTLEYHMGVVRHSMAEGRVEPIPHVFYSAQPMAMEMLYLLGAIFERTPWGLASGLAHWTVVVATAWMFAALLGRIVRSQPLRPWAIVLFLSHPIAQRVEIDRLTDLGGALFLLAGLTAIFHDEMDRDDAPEPALALAAGIFAGAAVSVKWTNAGTAALILTLVMGWYASRAMRLFGMNGLMGALPFAGGAAAVMIPWCAWLVLTAGSPFAPFLPVFASSTSDWRQENLDFLLFSHGYHGFFDQGYWRHLFHSIKPMGHGLPIAGVVILLGLAEIIRRMRRREVDRKGREDARHIFEGCEWAVLAGCMMAWIAWGRLEQAQERFLVPVFAAQIFVLTVFLDRLVVSRDRIGLFWRAITVVAFAAAAIPWWTSQLRLVRAIGYWDHAAGRIGSDEFLAARLGGTLDFFKAANELPPGSKVLAIGEARNYYMRGETTLSSVFDTSPLEQWISRKYVDSKSIGLHLSAGMGYTHVLVNEFELARLLLFHPPMPLAADKRLGELRRIGMTPENLCDIAREYLEWGVARTAGAESDSIRLDIRRFLMNSRMKATYIQGDGTSRPWMWIAPLEAGSD